jgi:hypothetical protein
MTPILVRPLIFAFALLAACSVPPCRAQSTQPSAAPTPTQNTPAHTTEDLATLTTKSLEAQTLKLADAGDNAAALPLLRELEKRYPAGSKQANATQTEIRRLERLINLGPATGDSRVPITPPAPGEVKEFESIKDLGNFDYDVEKGGNIPPDIAHLNHSSIRIRGFMIPMDSAENIQKFALVPSLFSCCMGQPPQIQHTIVVVTPKGKAVSYFPDEIIVEGPLTVEEKKEDGFIVSIFEVSATSVKPASR